MRLRAMLEFIPSYVWFFAKLSALLFVYVWVRGTLPRIRVDQMMNFAWKFMLPMAFTCIIARCRRGIMPGAACAAGCGRCW